MNSGSMACTRGLRIPALLACSVLVFAVATQSVYGKETSRVAGTSAHPTLNVGLNASVLSLDPGQSVQFPDRYVMYAIYNTLVDLDSQNNVRPGLATSWSFPNTTTLKLNLRHGVTFTDGTAFTASVVKWNLERDINPANNLPRLTDVAKIKSVSTQGPYTVLVHLKAPAPELLATFGDRAGMMVSPKAVEKSGSEAKGSKYGAQSGVPPVGTGPFMFKSWPTADTINLVDNPHYWDKGAVHFRAITFHIIDDNTTRVTEVRTGQLDIADQLGPLDVKPVQGDSSVKVSSYLTQSWYDLEFNLKDSPFNSKLIRQAMALAINRNEIKKVAFFNTGNANPHIITGGWAYDPGQPVFPYNPTKARQLLAKAGYPHGFSATLQLPTGDTPSIDMGQVIQSNLSQVGIHLTPQLVEGSQGYAEQLAGKVPLATSTWTTRADPGFTMNMHYHSGVLTDHYQYDNPTVDRLIDQANSTYDTATRKKLLDRAARIVANDAPLIMLHSPETYAVMNSHLTGFHWLPDTIMRVAYLGWK